MTLPYPTRMLRVRPGRGDAMATGSGGAGRERAGTAVEAVAWMHSLRTRLTLWTSLGSAALLLAVIGLTYVAARQILLEKAREGVRAQAEQIAIGMERTFEAVAIAAGTLAEGVREAGHDRERLDGLLRTVVVADPNIVGAMLVLEPGALLAGGAGHTWYVRRQGDGTLYEQSMSERGYDYRSESWWHRTRNGKRPWWSEPYRSEATGGELFVTYNRPVWAVRGEQQDPVVGMVSVDVPVHWLRIGLGQELTGDLTRRILLSPERRFVVHPNPDLELQTTLDELVTQPAYGRLTSLVTALRAGEGAEATYRDPTTGANRLTLMRPLVDSGWTLGLSVSERLVLEELNDTTRAVALGSALAVLSLWLLMGITARRVTRPLGGLTESAGHFAAGEFDWPLPHTQRRDEVGVMARAFDHARSSIKQQMGEIEAMAAARQRLDSELAIARDIQLSMLPPPRRLQSGGAVVEVHGALEPAKAVGGDFYTFFERTPGSLWFVIGDVSDKGVPAALFMARTVTVLEAAARVGGQPDDALRVAARQLAEGNDACMFATVLCGVLDTATGALVLASAGHDAPALLREVGGATFVPLATGGALGLDSSGDYPLWHGTLAPGEALVAFTDGITESFNDAHEAFGEARLLGALELGRDAASQCAALVAGAHAHAAGAPQSDDITVLVIARAMAMHDDPSQSTTRGGATAWTSA